jgi:hypothetical protein
MRNGLGICHQGPSIDRHETSPLNPEFDREEPHLNSGCLIGFNFAVSPLNGLSRHRLLPNPALAG